MPTPCRTYIALSGFAFSLALPLCGSVVVARMFPGSPYANVSLHAVLETIGGIMALAIAGMLLIQQPRRPGHDHFLWMACALIGMGILELFHAAAQPGNNFVWLRTLASCLGGLLFACVWLPVPPGRVRWLPGLVLVVALGCGATSCWSPARTPLMLVDGEFTRAARSLGIVGGLGFAIASVFFVRRFHRQGHRDDWLFAANSQLFAVAAGLFEFSVLWDASWWWWHALRLLGYSTAWVFATANYWNTENELVDLNQRLTQINRDLDRTVAERTAELSASEERFARAVRGSTDGLWDWNVQTDEVYYSPRFKELLGHAECEMENSFHAFQSRLHPDDREHTLEAVRAHVERRVPYDVEYRLQTKSQGYRWFRARGQAIWNEAGQALRMAGSITDVTEQKHSQQRFQLAVEASPAALLMVDGQGRIQLANSQCQRLFGYARDELLGQSIHRLIPRPPGEPDAAEQASWLVTPTARMLGSGRELYALRKDGTEFAAEIGLGPVETEDGVATICGIADITDRKRALEAMRTAKEAAEAASRAKSDFLANMSHEIRTPLNAVIGMTELVLDTELTPSQREFLTMVLQSGESLLTIVNEILDFSKIEAGKVELEQVPFALREMLDDTLKSLAVRARQKHLELTHEVAADLPEDLVGDPHRLRQVFLNLVGNAIKFTEVGKVSVHVACRSRTAHGLQLRCTVSDTGIGIPAAKRAAIFESFTQADTSTTRRFGGTGLGLTICAQLVELMGGEIGVDSEEGRGSTFHFTVSLECGHHPPAPAEAVAIKAALPTQRPLRILVVEDGLVNQKLALGLLRNWGHTVTLAKDGREAVAAVESQPFDLVLMDIQMPDMNGWEATIAIRQRERQRGGHLPILAMTAHVMPGDREQCLAAGMDGFVSKPVRQHELYAAISRCQPLCGHGHC